MRIPLPHSRDGARGAVFESNFSGLTTATRTLFEGELRELFGVAAARVGGDSSLHTAESLARLHLRCRERRSQQTVSDQGGRPLNG